MIRWGFVLYSSFCFGLNLIIPFIKKSKWSKVLIALIILNELRGLAMFYAMSDDLYKVTYESVTRVISQISG